MHIGHIAASLPGDILARYFRAKGDVVFFVSGSDCHGTPVEIRVRKKNKMPESRPTNHLYLAITRMKDELGKYIEGHRDWRKMLMKYKKWNMKYLCADYRQSF